MLSVTPARRTGPRSRRPGTKVARALLAGALLAALPVLPVAPAFADPPRPTDYRSEIVSITPEVDGIEVAILGGDAFIELDAGGHEVVVPGYEGEPYLTFAADGTVSVNVRSPAYFYNQDRYSRTRPPAEADADAAAVWRVVDDDGRYAWHDHRTHWMQETPPLGLGPGDQILDQVIPLTVDGITVEIAVVSRWMAPPSIVPSVLGALAAALVAVGTLVAGRGRVRGPVLLVAAAAALALVVGLWQTWSLPAETGPPWSHWVVPSAALALCAAALGWPRWSVFTVRSLTVVAAVGVVLWAAIRIEVVRRAVLPTSAPFWFDRAATVAAAATAFAALCASVLGIVRLASGPLRPAASAVGDAVPGASGSAGGVGGVG
jgi:hypothetical protein